MNVNIIRQNYGKKQITLKAMQCGEFVALIEALDHARYEGGLNHA